MPYTKTAVSYPPLSSGTIEDVIEHMRAHGQSLDLNWGEDTGMWEVAWITGGERFIGLSTALWSALGQSLRKAEARFGVKVPA